eukprot:TRINITY_DN2438_c0_g2_i1.p1 TRINITY_DN2438_c0_g2~~TRINITY_DN2438_c0_g2_i1.p1  ORF type:complete len:867 (+),score=279.70 TRINITY_DN2438_c0_g2_i1:93-2693(+)
MAAAQVAPLSRRQGRASAAAVAAAATGGVVVASFASSGAPSASESSAFLSTRLPEPRSSGRAHAPAAVMEQQAASGTPSPQEGFAAKVAGAVCGVGCVAGAVAATSRRGKRSAQASTSRQGATAVHLAAQPFAGGSSSRHQPRGAVPSKTRRLVAPGDPDVLRQVVDILGQDASSSAPQVAAFQATAQQVASELGTFLNNIAGPVQPASAAETIAAPPPATDEGPLKAIADFFFDPRLQWDENGKILKDPQGNDLPDNLWTQFVAVQATLIKRLDEAIATVLPGSSFGIAIALYTLMIRTALYPLVKGQMETTAKIQILKPRVDELKEQYKGKENEEKLQQEVGMLYMDLQIDPLAAILPLLLQLPVFWGLYRAIRRLGIVQYPHLKQSFLWIPSLFGPGFTADPKLDWVTQWQGPLIELHPKIGWETFGLYSILPIAVFFSYRAILGEALEDKNSPQILQVFPFMLGFICTELPQAMGIYIATNVASSVALTSYTKSQIAAKIPGYEEFVKTGKWPAGVDPEKVLAKAFGVQRLSGNDDLEDPVSIPEAIFAGRADHIPVLLEEGKSIDMFDEKGIPASAYTLALNNPDLLERLFELGADPFIKDKKNNSLMHYAAGYGRGNFLEVLLEKRGLGKIINEVNEDGQTPLDVARMNLGQEKICEEVRPVVKMLEDAGAEGKVTTAEDAVRFEEEREKRKKQAQVSAARNALMQIAEASAKQQQAEAEKKAEEADGAEKKGPDVLGRMAERAKLIVTGLPEEETKPEDAHAPKAPEFLAESLDRVKSLDFEALKAKLGDKMTDEQLMKLQKRLEKMTPEEVACFTAGVMGTKTTTASGAEEASAPAEGASHNTSAAVEAPRKTSVLVD